MEKNAIFFLTNNYFSLKYFFCLEVSFLYARILLQTTKISGMSPVHKTLDNEDNYKFI